MNWPSYPKILHLGNPRISHLFQGEVEITEKLDGSQFSFGLDDEYRLWCRSKEAHINIDAPPNMFAPAVEYLKRIRSETYAPCIPPRIIFYAEVLSKPKHNVLTYSRVPRNYIALFGAWNREDNTWCRHWDYLNTFAAVLGVDIVPEFYTSQLMAIGDLKSLLDRESFLGGTKIEGVVVKNYNQVVVLTPDVILPIAAGKFVSEEFKEKHSSKAYGKKESKNNLDEYFGQFKTEARWRKAVQHLRDRGVLESDPRDIGPLIKEIETDLVAEHQEEIKDRLWKEYRREIVGRVTKGFPEWFKQQLLEGTLN